MNLLEEIEAEHSKSQTARIIEWVGADQLRFDALFALFTGPDPVVAQRASWPLSYCVVNHPVLINKHLKALLENVERPGRHAAVRRNTVRLLQAVAVPEEFSGGVMDLCFRLVESPKEPVAVKAFSLTVLHNLSKSYPEILPEIRLLIEARWPYETAAFHSRARKILRGR